MMTQDNDKKKTALKMNKRTMPLSWALALIIAIALAGGIAFYIQAEKTSELAAAAELAFADQQNRTMVAFDQIEMNLASIREHESMIQQDFTGPDKTGNMAPEERIQKEIDYIQYLLNENNNLIASLENKIEEKDSRMKNYEKTVSALKVRVKEYQSQLDNLIVERNNLQRDLNLRTGERDDLAGQVNQLGKHVQQQDSLITAQQTNLKEREDQLHSAYFTVGTYKELRDREVLTKEGGFLGINRVKTLVEDPSANQFKMIDTRTVTRIPIFSKHFEIIGERVPSSYEVEYANARAEWLNIKDPEKFWKKSPYLVIVVREEDNTELAQSR